MTQFAVQEIPNLWFIHLPPVLHRSTEIKELGQADSCHSPFINLSSPITETGRIFSHDFPPRSSRICSSQMIRNFLLIISLHWGQLILICFRANPDQYFTPCPCSTFHFISSLCVVFGVWFTFPTFSHPVSSEMSSGLSWRQFRMH